MRIYLPATLLDLVPDSGGTRPPVSARRGHAVTAPLRALFPEDGDEGLEFAAQLAAADGSLDLLGAAADAPRLRLVLTADVADHLVAAVHDEDAAPTSVDVTVDVPWDSIVCGLVDEPAAQADVVAALTGAPGAVELLDDRDLLWYDVTELGSIPR